MSRHPRGSVFKNSRLTARDRGIYNIHTTNTMVMTTGSRPSHYGESSVAQLQGPHARPARAWSVPGNPRHEARNKLEMQMIQTHGKLKTKPSGSGKRAKRTQFPPYWARNEGARRQTKPISGFLASKTRSRGKRSQFARGGSGNATVRLWGWGCHADSARLAEKVFKSRAYFRVAGTL